MSEHQILEEFLNEEERWTKKTTHLRIAYDSLTEVFIVDLGNGTWCEVYGKNRFAKAVQIADSIIP